MANCHARFNGNGSSILEVFLILLNELQVLLVFLVLLVLV